MTVAVTELDALVEAVAGSEATRKSTQRAEPAVADDVAAAVSAWKAPVRVVLAGRPGVGLSTVVAALGLPAETAVVTVDDPHQSVDGVIAADVVIYVLAVSATETDEAAVDDLVRNRSIDPIVVLNKADAIDTSWATVFEVAREHAVELRAPTYPLVGSVAVQTRAGVLTDAEMRSLRQLAAVPDASLTMSPELFLGAHVGTDVRARRTMLEHWDLFGLDCAIEALRADPTLEPAQVLQLMQVASGIEKLLPAVAARVDRVGAVRSGALLDALERCAARVIDVPSVAAAGSDEDSGPESARDVIETFLRSDVGCHLGLMAGLACQELDQIAAEYGSVHPGSPNDALALADRWREVVADSGVSPVGRRAAQRIHQGYVRLWEQSTSQPIDPAVPEVMSHV